METKNVELSKRQLKIIEESMAIEAEDAKQAGMIGYMARMLVQTTLPHADPGDVQVWGRENGRFSLAIQPGIYLRDGVPVNIGVPYGIIPRHVLSWITTEAVRTRNPCLELGETLTSFMAELGMASTGGKNGTIGRLQEQLKRLFSASIACYYDSTVEGIFASSGVRVAREVKLWWDPKRPGQVGLWKSEVVLSTDFFEQIIDRPVPIDIRAMKALGRSPMAIDLYNWLTYRMSYLSKQTTVPWEALSFQFGSEYGTLNDFRKKLRKHMREVLVVYPRARVEETRTGLLLHPSTTHVRRVR